MTRTASAAPAAVVMDADWFARHAAEHPHADEYEPGDVTPLGRLLAGLTADDMRAVVP